MLHVLTAQIVADERERAIQRRLREQAVRREAVAANAIRPAQAANVHTEAKSTERPCGDCPPVGATAC